MDNEDNARVSAKLENPLRLEAPLAKLSARFVNPPALKATWKATKIRGELPKRSI
jgi:hypothetical protein